MPYGTTIEDNENEEKKCRQKNALEILTFVSLKISIIAVDVPISEWPTKERTLFIE